MKRVLIVEANAADARALQEALRQAGLSHPTVVKNVGGAKRNLAARGQNAIVMLNLPATAGSSMEFLDWLRAQTFYEDLLVIAMGERGQLRAVVNACERGANTFVIKPVHAEDLKALARSHPCHWARAPE